MPVNRRARAIAVGSVLALTVALFSLEYTVKRGDTLSEIARDHNVSLSDVIELNETLESRSDPPRRHDPHPRSRRLRGVRSMWWTRVSP